MLVTCVFQASAGTGEWGTVPGVRAVASFT